MLNARNIVNNLMAKCESISKRMAEQVQTLVQHQADDDVDADAFSSSSSKRSAIKDLLEIKSQPKNLNKAYILNCYIFILFC